MNRWIDAWRHLLKHYELNDCLSVTGFSGKSQDGNHVESTIHSHKIVTWIESVCSIMALNYNLGLNLEFNLGMGLGLGIK